MAELVSKDVVGDAVSLVAQLGRTSVIPSDMLPRLKAMTRELHEAWREAAEGGAIVDLAIPLSYSITKLVDALLEEGNLAETQRRDVVRGALVGVVQAFEYFESRSGLVLGEPRALLDALLSDLRITQSVLASWLGCGQRTLQHWLKGESEPDSESVDLIRRISTLVTQLHHLYTPSGVVEWLSEPMALLGDRPPIEAIREQEQLERVLRLIWRLRGQ